MYVVIPIQLYGQVSDKNFFTQSISRNKTTFFALFAVQFSNLVPWNIENIPRKQNSLGNDQSVDKKNRVAKKKTK